MSGSGDERTLDLAELGGELREFTGRVVGLEIRDEDTNLIASGEGEFGHLNGSADSGWSFQLGGDAPPEREGLRFIVASWIVVYIDPARLLEIHDISTGIGAPIVLRVRITGGLSITVWPAMPAREQWTDRHEENR